MTRKEFIDEVVEEVTEGGAIPVKPKEKRMNSIIDRALKYFWEQDDQSVEHEYIIISKEVVNTPLFKDKRKIKMPKCVEAIAGLQETGSLLNTGSNNINPDYRKTNFNYHLAVGGDSDTMLYGVMAGYYTDFIRNFVIRRVTYDFNPHSSMLIIKGRDHFFDLVAEAYVHLSEEGMFEYDRFFRYVVGKVKVSFSRVFGFVDAKVIGGLNIDISEVKSEGKEEIKEVKEEIDKDKDTVDFLDEF